MARTAGAATARKPTAPRPVRRPPARRKSGPARATAAPRRAAAPAPALAPRPLRSLAGVAARQVSRERAGALLDRLLRGRGWVLCVGVLLAGIVFFNVSLLELNSGITRTNERAAALKRENAGLRQEVASLGSSERIQTLAAERGMVLPAPADVTYVHANPAVDVRRALRLMSTPTPVTAPTAGLQAAPAGPPATGSPAGVAAPVAPSPAPQSAPPAPQAPPQQAPPAVPQQAPGPAAQG
jgi:cell division protein FtsL